MQWPPAGRKWLECDGALGWQALETPRQVDCAHMPEGLVLYPHFQTHVVPG